MNIEKLRGKRGYVKGKLTRIATFVEDVKIKKISTDYEDVSVRLDRMDAIEHEFQSLMTNIIECSENHKLTDDDAVEEERFETQYYEIKAMLSRWREKLKPRPAASGDRSTGASVPSTLEQVLQQQADILRQISMQQSDERSPAPSVSSHVRLPVINLPTFDGKVEEWKRFSDTFKTLIHDSEIPNVQKHQYLVSALSGIAAKTIEAIEISDQNYEVAWQLLKDRFDNDKTLRRRHIQCLFEMPRVDKESSTAIQNLVDHTQKHLRVLKSMKLPTENWDELLLFMMEDKLDKLTRRQWEESIEGKENVTVDTMVSFLQRRCQLLDRMTSSSDISIQDTKSTPKTKLNDSSESSRARKGNQTNRPVSLVATSHTGGRCYMCKGPHFIYSCEGFLKLSADNRITEAKRLKLCINCLKNDHFVKTCKASSCRECGGRHNTLCHKPIDEESESSKKPISTNNGDRANVPAVHHIFNSGSDKYILLSTAIVNVIHANGSVHQLRVLLDSASEANFITSSACNRIGTKLIEFNESISGLNNMSCKINHSCQITLNSRVSNCQLTAQCVVVPKITKELPSAPVNTRALSISSTIKLADPKFSEPGNIDMLLGGEFFFDLLDHGKIELGVNLPILQNTKLGWIVSGPVTARVDGGRTMSSSTPTALTCLYIQKENINELLTKFWEVEECDESETPKLSNEEEICENLFQENVSRDQSGRFNVRLPFNGNQLSLGESRNIAEKRLMYLERKFKTNERFRNSYINFMQEYIELGHMTAVPASHQSSKIIVYLPHHGIWQESLGKAKFRVVFDASAKTSSGLSLNDTLLTGATLQDDLFDIILRFRLHSIVITADLKKMYRQIKVEDRDRDYQRILWRFSPDDKIQEYQLNTVTYGQSCAPFLAIRCVRQLASEESKNYEKASRVLLQDLYVDDILTGVNSLHDARSLISQLQDLLRQGQFELHKWKFNRTELTSFVSESSESTNSRAIVDGGSAIKTLGLEWEPVTDTFQFNMQPVGPVKTKRQILSTISKLFDPLGVVSPIIVRAKLIIQETWRLNIGWDDELPDRIILAWECYIQDLTHFSTIHVPRCVLNSTKSITVNLHAFCDASERAYGACVYVQTTSESNSPCSMLLCAKSRVAPIKKLTIPKLELCGAVLLVHLVSKVRGALQIEFNSIHAWTDSTIVLAWISGDTNRQKTFVSNRVTKITAGLSPSHWHHVQGEENPADLVSRGANFETLRDTSLWWSGPPWLSNFSDHSSRNLTELNLSQEDLEIIRTELKSEPQVFIVSKVSFTAIDQIINQISSLTKIERILAYWFRFIFNSRSKKSERACSELSVAEISRAHHSILKHVQNSHFSKEIHDLRSEGQVNIKSPILGLNPILDGSGLLRVGGRLEHSSLAYDAKHPILLPSNHRFTKLLFEKEHRRLAHAGPQALLFSIRERYWPLRGRNVARAIVNKCIHCFRNKPRQLTQIMGHLPSDRVKPQRAFFVSGVDFAGPITTLVNKGRGRKTNKSYIALFICFATKEVVSDLSAASFIAALRRFVGRRGCPQKIFSDNATNFQGTRNELRELYESLRTEFHDSIDEFCSVRNIEWSFIPPSSPHMGGLWEAGVKSCKFHLKRVIGLTLLTFEELYTVLVQVEACLNSRPLCPLPSTPFDLQPLTPAHFLVGEPLTNLPDADVTDLPTNRLSRWQVIQRITQDFWNRWKREYLTSLQGRSKWNRDTENLKINDVVLIHDSNSPPLQWSLGKVIKLHPGADEKVRVATVKTASTTLKRPIVKLCKLPIDADDLN